MNKSNDSIIFKDILEAIPDERLIEHLEDGDYIIYDPDYQDEFLDTIDALTRETHEEVIESLVSLIKENRIDDALLYAERILNPKFASVDDSYIALAKSK